MKKILLYLSCVLVTLFLVGCTLDNTPTKKVENFLDNYKNLNSDVVTQLDQIVATDATMTTTQRDQYKEVLKRQYQDMMYTIKDEVVDGDKATVTVEVEVYDYYKVNTDADTYYQTSPDEFKDTTGAIAQDKYVDYRITKMNDTKEKVKYTMDFTLTKLDDIWTLDDISETNRQKIHGLYAY